MREGQGPGGPVPAPGRDRRQPAGTERSCPPRRTRAAGPRVHGALAAGEWTMTIIRSILLVSILAARALAAEPGHLAGSVSDATGGPVAGALVTARHLDLARSTTVYADM